MNRSAAFGLVLILVASALAGCAKDPPPASTTPTGSTSTPTTSTPVSTTPVTTTPNPTGGNITADDFALAASGIPASVEAGKPFTFKLFVNGTKSVTSDHIGGHFGLNSTNTTNGSIIAPSTTFYPNLCVHVNGALPGAFDVECTLVTPGTYYLRPHTRVNDSGTFVHFWAPEATILAVGNYTVQTSIPDPATARLNQPFEFTMWVNGTGNLTVGHLGAHYNTSSRASSPPTTTAYNKSCVHEATTYALPGEFKVTCIFDDPTGLTVYLRGHTRVTDAAGRNWDFWGPEQSITVLPV